MKTKIWKNMLRGSSALVLTGILAACSANAETSETVASSVTSESSTVTSSTASSEAAAVQGDTQSTEEYDLTFSSSDLETGYDEESATQVKLADGKSTVEGEGVTVEGDIVTITQGGDYVLSGSLTNGQVIVSVNENEKVHLILNGVDITSQSSAPILITEAEKVWITLAEGSENSLTDTEGSAATIGTGEDATTVDGTIFSRADLALNGAGSLTIQANTQHGIVSKDDLIITGGTYTINANGQGLAGKDAVKINSGTFTLTTTEDAIQSDNAEEAGRGFIYIAGGSFTIDSQGDALQAETLLQIDGGSYDILTGGGSENGVVHTESRDPFSQSSAETETTDTADTVSTKGLKAANELIVNGGEFTFDTADDSIHSNGSVTLSGGMITAASGDDGIHADADLLLNGSDITLTQSYEGIEGNTITVDSGNISLVASDDGFNVAGGNDQSSMGRPGENTFAANSENQLIINGGTITVDSQGDGLDSNGTITINGGDISVSGPENDGNGTLDSGAGVTISGGTVKGAGSSGMAEGFSTESSQVNVLHNLESAYEAGTAIEVKTIDGEVLLSWTAEKSFSSVIFSSADLTVGTTYILSVGGDETEITLEDTVTSNGGGMQSGGMGGGMRGEMPFGTQPGQAPEEETSSESADAL